MDELLKNTINLSPNPKSHKDGVLKNPCIKMSQNTKNTYSAKQPLIKMSQNTKIHNYSVK